MMNPNLIRIVARFVSRIAGLLAELARDLFAEAKRLDAGEDTKGDTK